MLQVHTRELCTLQHHWQLHTPSPPLVWLGGPCEEPSVHLGAVGPDLGLQ